MTFLRFSCFVYSRLFQKNIFLLFLFLGSRTPSQDFYLCTVQYLAGCRDSNPSCCDRSQVCYQWANISYLYKLYLYFQDGRGADRNPRQKSWQHHLSTPLHWKGITGTRRTILLNKINIFCWIRICIISIGSGSCSSFYTDPKTSVPDPDGSKFYLQPGSGL